MEAIDKKSARFRNETSFRYSILTVSLVAMTLAFAVTVVSAALYNRDKGLRGLKQSAELSTNIVAKPLAYLLDHSDSATATMRLLALSLDPNFRAASVIDPSGRVIISLPAQPGASSPPGAPAARPQVSLRNRLLIRKPLYSAGPGRRFVGTLAVQYTLANVQRRFWLEFAGSVLGALLVIGLVGLILHIALGRITLPLEQLAETVFKIAEGDLASEVPSRPRKDEIGALARAIQFFKERLAEREALQTEKALTQAQTDAQRHRLDALLDRFRLAVADTLGQVNGQGDAMTVAATSLAGVATESSQQADEAAHAITESSSNVRTVARASEELSSSIGEIERQVTKTRRVVADAASTTAETHAATDALAAKAEEIGEIIALIQAIAEQTNMLALNATIEAVRAGEAGRGFAVVAQEVKSLASQTTRASQRIAEHALAIQAVSDKMIEAIASIAATMAEAQSATDIIAVAVKQQSEAATEISRSVGESAAGTEVAAEKFNHFAASAAETEASANKVHRAAANVATQTKRLSETVDSFLRNVAAL